MKVIMIGSHLRVKGGITRVVKNYLKAGLTEKVDFEYLPTYYGSNNFINIIYYFKQYILLTLKLYILNKNYDIAHIHMSYKGSFIRKKYIIDLLTKRKIPIIIHMHGSRFRNYYMESSFKQKKKIEKTLNKARIILALGQQWKDFYSSITQTRVISFENAVFPKDKSEEFEDKKIYITTMGILSERKGTFDLIRAASKLKGKVSSKYKFLVAGNGAIDRVKEELNKQNLNEMFIIPGWISDQNKIERIYKKSVIYVLPSYNEGMPMSVLEAMSYGLPIISTKVGSIPSVIKNENGILIEPGNVDALSKSIIELLNDRDRRQLMEQENLKKIEKYYNIYTSVNQLVKIYNSIQ